MSALSANTYTDSILKNIALLAGGDARVALYILLKSAIAAENDRAGQISTRHIPTDISAWQRLEKISRIQRLPQHQQLIYKLSKKHGQLSSTKLRRIYLINCYNESIEPVARRTFTKNIAQLAQHNLISIEPRMIGGPGRVVKAAV